MNIPFSLALTSSNPYGVLWSAAGASAVPTSVQNSILTTLAGQGATVQSRFSLVSPSVACWVTGICIVGDTASTKVSLGVYDTGLSTYFNLYDFLATEVAAGGFVRQFGVAESGIYLPLSLTVLPVLKLQSGSSVNVSGDIGLMPIPGPTAGTY